jgi:hypothetical protein
MLLLLALGGCASIPSGGQGPSNEDLAHIQIGVATAGDVKSILGPPLRVTRYDRQDRDVWEYRRYNDPMDEWHIAVQFSKDGIAREVVKVKDLNREPCGP